MVRARPGAFRLFSNSRQLVTCVFAHSLRKLASSLESIGRANHRRVRASYVEVTGGWKVEDGVAAPAAKIAAISCSLKMPQTNTC